jgi:hypothetical protein
MPGRAAGMGAFNGNRNALVTGLHTHQMIEQRQAVSTLVQQSRDLLDDLK